MRRTIERVENLDGAHAHLPGRLVLDLPAKTDIDEDVQRLFALIGARALWHFDDLILPVAPPHLQALAFDVEHSTPSEPNMRRSIWLPRCLGAVAAPEIEAVAPLANCTTAAS